MNKAYPKYKPSGVEWLGDVPEHWDVKRTRFMISMNPSKKEIQYFDPETELAFLPMEAVGEDGSLRIDSTRPISDVNAGYTFFAEGDIAFAKITPCFENRKGAILRNLGTGFGFGTTELTVMRSSENLDAEYLYYVTISDEFRHNGKAWMYGAGGQKRVPDEFVKEFRFGFPPLAEQRAIAAFLERETGRIDALTSKKQRLLELLAEQRTALISRAVTKGLDVSIKMNPSGVEWLGDMPDHWEVMRLKYIVSLKSGEGITVEDIEEDSEYPVYGGNGFRGYTEKYTHDGDFVIVGRQGALCGNINYASGKFWASEHAVVADPHRPIAVFWMGELLRIMNLNQYAISAAQPGLSIDRIKELLLPLPPLPEQQAIAAFLDCETAKIDALSVKVNTIIDRLKEYRAALISAVVERIRFAEALVNLLFA